MSRARRPREEEARRRPPPPSPASRRPRAAPEPFSARDMVHEEEMASRLEEREPLARRVLERIEERGGRIDPYFDRLSIDEAISNAVIHGNRGDPAKKVRVRAFVRDGGWGVEVTDEGEGFDHRRWLARLGEPPDLESPSGRGIALILGSGAELRFLDGGRRLLIVRGGKGGEER